MTPGGGSQTGGSARLAPSRILLETPVVAVLRASRAEDYGPVIRVLADHGVRSIEVTLSTPGTFDVLPRLISEFGADVEIGVGTIVGEDDARQALDLGAAYLVTPITRLGIIDLAVEAGVPVYPGGLTPTELYSAWEAGATAVKIFPAGTVGAQYGAHLRGPFPDLQFVPSGGIGLDSVGDWLSAGALAVSLGGPLVGDALRGGSLDALAARARKVTELAASARPAT